MKFSNSNKQLYLLILINFALPLLISPLELPKKPAEKDPLSDLSDAELDKLMKDYGLSNKDLGILSTNSTKAEKTGKKKYDLLDLNDDEDPLKNLLKNNNKNVTTGLTTPSAIFSHNRNLLKKFHISQRNAYNLVNMLKRLDIFNRLPISAKNIVAVGINLN